MPPPIKSLLEAPKGLQGGTPKPLPTTQTPPSRHPLLQGGFEGSVDSVLGFLGFGPQTKANLIGQLISAALPVYHGMPGGFMGPPERGGGGLPKVPGVATEVSQPADLYTKPLKPYEEALIRHLDTAVNDRQAAMAQNPYNLPDVPPTAALPSRMAEREQKWQADVHDIKGQAIKTQREYSTRNLQRRISTIERNPEAAIARHQAARITVDTPKQDVPQSSITGTTPPLSAKVNTRTEALKKGKLSRDTIVAIREWHMDPTAQRLSSGQKIEYIRNHFIGDTPISDSGIHAILNGDSFVGVGPHPNWANAPKPGAPKPKK